VESNPNEIVRTHIWVMGRVQGVGFRAHVDYFARQLGVGGWVRNVGKDTVEAIAEGRRVLILQFIEVVKEGPRMARVDETRLEWEPATGEFNDFGVK
jgi:acylphosphatase